MSDLSASATARPIHPPERLARRQHIAIVAVLLPTILLAEVNGIYFAFLSDIGLLAFWSVDVVQWVLLPALFLWLLARRGDIRPAQYGLEWPVTRPRALVLGTLAVLVTSGPAFFLTHDLIWEWQGQPTGLFDYPGMFPDGLAGTIIWIYSSLTAGIVESIFYIGLPWLLFASLRPDGSRLVLVLALSAVFASVHWEQGSAALIGAFCSQAVAWFWYFRLRSLWPLVGAHVIIDLIAFW